MAFRKLAALALTMSFALAGCGGGSGAEDDLDSLFRGFSSGDADNPAGMWIGKIPGNLSPDLQVVVQEDGTYWAMYGKIVDNALTVDAFLPGTFVGHMGQLRSFDLRDFHRDGIYYTGNMRATHLSGASIVGSAYGDKASINFSLAPSTTFNTNTPALAANIEGAWTMFLFDSHFLTTAVNITANGALTGTSGTCTITGTVVHSASGKNRYDVTTTYGAGCVQANMTTSGIAIWQRLPNSSSAQLIMTTINPTRTFGTVLSGIR